MAWSGHQVTLDTVAIAASVTLVELSAAKLIMNSAAIDALEKAREVPADVWAEVAEKLTGRERENFDRAEVALHFTCVGPPAAATLVFGIAGTKDEEGKGQYVYGQDMDQEPHEDGVGGKKIAYVQRESPESEEIDLSDSGHEQYQKELGAPGAQYYVIARYD